ncbi:MAG: glutamyl-tRNA reductase [Polyangiaceae bacterium]
MIVVIGLSHKTAPVDVRERFATGSDVLPQLLARLSARRELAEVMFLSTCNRVEVLACAQPNADGRAASSAIREALQEFAGLASAGELEPYLYERTGADAVRHVFRVSASLDSMVLGEPQILGQVKAAYDAASAAGTLKHYLGRCVHRAFTVAKRVRTETALGAGTVSISSVAVDLARKIFGDLSNHAVLLVGAGEMAEAAAKALGKGARSMRVCNRSFDRAAALAGQFGGSAAPLDALEEELTIADVVVTSTASATFVVTRDMVKRAMKARKGRTLFFIDIAVPRNVEPTVHQIDNVYVYNVDDLELQVAEGMKARTAEVVAAEKIVETELAEFEIWSRGLDVQPAVVALRAKTRAVLFAEMERSLASRLKHLNEADKAALTQMMESAVNKLLHAPTTRLKASAADGGAAEFVAALKHLFDLPEHAAVAPARGGDASGESAPQESEEDDDRVTH